MDSIVQRWFSEFTFANIKNRIDGYEAALNVQLDVVEMLVDHGVEIAVRRQGYSAVHAVVETLAAHYLAERTARRLEQQMRSLQDKTKSSCLVNTHASIDKTLG
jgi:hypothetical protein